ncbi:uncharacterized protein MELLADRAFT_114231 [Melampsora larici-populina 98AG31]|uniref:Uncharacterized protein n=1 Tax=Melampsora larici-populina (strain 98AG31 / pathotype 3-4-7) TaxID=747676 RepID=F4SCQ4_MELLP|nr:uncharacterized protein MELLADRAFT_114231 [Melampsora larici-populina 98AG31]EGF97575.1 hypothetical protein MELLADRAFT_114231 [Melampsora larici-populina 98AG31]
MIRKLKRIKLSNIRIRFGPRGGVRNRHTHHQTYMAARRKQVLMLKGSGQRHLIYGLTGFLALLHYTARHPPAGADIKKLVVEGVTEEESRGILSYFNRRTSHNLGLSQVVELRIKMFGRSRCVVHRLKKSRTSVCAIFDLNTFHLGCDGTIQTRNQRLRSLSVKGLGDFVFLVEMASREPDNTEDYGGNNEQCSLK